MIHYIPIDENTSGDSELMAAVEGQPIVVLAYTLVCDGPVNVAFANNSGNLTGPMSFAENGGASAPYNPAGHFATRPGEPLLLSLDDDVAVGGHATVQVGGGLRI